VPETRARQFAQFPGAAFLAVDAKRVFYRFLTVGPAPREPVMALTLLLCGTAVAVTALFVVAKPADAILAGQPASVPLSDPAAETLADHSGEHAIRTDWQLTTVTSLSDAEALLDMLEARGVEHRELLILGNATFAVRWR
jgi:hypothetical protein